MKIFNLSSAVVAIFALLFATMGCSIKSTSVPSPPASTQAFQIPSTYTTYTDETAFFSVSYPRQWEPVPDIANITAKAKDIINNLKSGLPIDQATILYIAGLKTTTGHSPGVVIVVEPSPSLLSNIDQVAAASMLVAKQLDPNSQEILRTKTVVNGKDAVLIEHKGQPSSTGPLFHHLTLVQLSGRTIWTVTCSAHDDVFSQWADDFSNITQSLKIAN